MTLPTEISLNKWPSYPGNTLKIINPTPPPVIAFYLLQSCVWTVEIFFFDVHAIKMYTILQGFVNFGYRYCIWCYRTQKWWTFGWAALDSKSGKDTVKLRQWDSCFQIVQMGSPYEWDVNVFPLTLIITECYIKHALRLAVNIINYNDMVSVRFEHWYIDLWLHYFAVREVKKK